MNRLTKLVCFIAFLAAQAFAAAWTGSTTEPENMKKIDGKSFYVITTADELAWFAVQVNSGKTTINAILDNDIVFGANSSSIGTSSWTPIGQKMTVAFNGIFDGTGHSIYGLYSSARDTSGFVGILNSSGILKDVSFINGSLNANNAGGLVGVNKGTIENCINKSVTIAGNSSKGKGGIAGINAGTIKSCSNNVVVDGNIAGGVAGINNGNIKNCVNSAKITGVGYVGGICAKNTGTLTNIKNSGSISASFAINSSKEYNSYTKGYCTINTFGGDVFAGGLCAYNEGLVEKSENSGAVFANGTVGGIAGYNAKSIQNTINKGSVEGRDSSYSVFKGADVVGNKWRCTYKSQSVYAYVGGLVGVNTGNSAVLTNSFNIANLTAENAKGKGGVASRNLSSASIINSYYDATVLSGLSIVGENSASVKNVEGKTTENMKKDQFAWILNTANGSSTNSGVWSRYADYPVLASSEFLPIYKIVFNDEGATSNRYNTYKGTVSFPDHSEASTGYSFDGWYSGATKVTSTTIFTADQVVKTKYSPVSFTILFKNYDGSELEQNAVEYGSIPVCSKTPERPANDEWEYTFKNWSPSVDSVKGNAEYTATFDSSKVKYPITFINFDDTELSVIFTEYGAIPTYPDIPTRANEKNWAFSFKGWTPILSSVKEPVTYKAVYDSSIAKYEVIFKDYNGNIIQSSKVEYGEKPNVPTEVSRTSSDEWEFSFKGWDKEIALVSGSATYIATYDSTKRTYKISFVDYDNSELFAAKFEYGETPVCEKEPEREANNAWSYKFKAWSPAIEKVSKDQKYTAVYDSSKNAYTIVFKNDNDVVATANVIYGETYIISTTATKIGYKFIGWYVGDDFWGGLNDSIVVKSNVVAEAKFEKAVYEIIFKDYNGDVIQSSKVEYGETPVCEKEPERKADNTWSYKFKTWSPAIEKVSKDQKYTAVYDSSKVTYSSSSVAESSSSSKPVSSSSVKSSSSSVVKASSSSAKSSSSSVKSSSSKKTDALVVTAVPKFSVEVLGRNVQIANAKVGSTYALFDMQGKVLIQDRVASADFNVVVPRSGNYLLRIGNRIQRVTVK